MFEAPVMISEPPHRQLHGENSPDACDQWDGVLRPVGAEPRRRRKRLDVRAFGSIRTQVRAAHPRDGQNDAFVKRVFFPGCCAERMTSTPLAGWPGPASGRAQ